MADDLVHARYLGGTEVVMPDLAGRDRCCRPENQRSTDLPERGPIPATVLRRGDVILLDRASAEGREDFEVVDEPHAPKATKPRATKAAPSDKEE